MKLIIIVLLNINNVMDLKNMINVMELFDGIGMDIGVFWGGKVFFFSLCGVIGGDFVDCLVDFDDEEIIKIVIIMMDGEIIN